MTDTAGVAFYVVAHPEDGADEAWRMRHADETVNVMSAFFKAPHGEPVQEPDGTYEVRAPAPSSVSIVRQMLTEHEGLVIVREEPLTGTFTDLLTTEEQRKGKDMTGITWQALTAAGIDTGKVTHPASPADPDSWQWADGQARVVFAPATTETGDAGWDIAVWDGDTVLIHGHLRDAAGCIAAVAGHTQA